MNYSEVRPQIKSGDIIAVRDKTFTSKLIRYFSGESFSHVAIAWRCGRHVMLIEAHMGTGIRIRPMSAALKEGQILRVISTEEDYWTNDIEDFALKVWATPYSIVNCILAWLGFPLVQNGDWQCAEFCSIILKMGGIDIHCEYVTPGALVESLLIQNSRMIDVLSL